MFFLQRELVTRSGSHFPTWSPAYGKVSWGWYLPLFLYPPTPLTIVYVCYNDAMRKIMRCRKIFFTTIIVFGGVFLSQSVFAQELVLDKVTTEKAEVLEVLKQETKKIPGTDTTTIVQSINVKILDGSDAGLSVTIDNDYTTLESGDVVYVTHTTNTLDGSDYYFVADVYRLPALYMLIGLFVFCVFIFGGKQGIRGLLSLIGSLFIILYVLIPAIIHGYPALLVSIGISSLIIIVGSYITHGWNRTTTSAVIGMIITIIMTGLLAYASVKFAHLTGMSNEESVYLNFNTHGIINLRGLLLGGIMIGLLGVLYDVAIGQAVAVEELAHAGAHLSRKELYQRALRIGREHIGALVNMLAIAYVGVSLTLLLLYSTSDSDWRTMLNREIFATELVRIMVGSIGVILAVPITTLISVLRIKTKKSPLG